MEKYSRNQRLALITKILTENPNRILGLNSFAQRFQAAKSTISEDILILRETLEKAGQGKLETVVGVSGGVRYRVSVTKAERERFQAEIISFLKDPSRIVPGNFLYVTDLMMNPRIIRQAGEILGERFQSLQPDYIITVETKGIPLAYEVARCLGVGLIVVRRSAKITEGSAISVNYLSGNQGLLSVMSLAKRSLRSGSRLVFIDDFLRGGGTVRGIMDLLHEFGSSLSGVGVMVASREESQRSVPVPYVSFCDYYGVTENGEIKIKASDSL